MQFLQINQGLGLKENALFRHDFSGLRPRSGE
jgi:hypothetical protein